MNKKYLPLLILILAALLLFWVKKHQRGPVKQNKYRVETGAALPEDFDRTIRPIIYSKHSRCRMDCREIDESEVTEILEKGRVNEDKIESDNRGITYPLEGVTHDGQHVRIVFAPKTNKLIVVTVIDLETEYVCDCN